MNRWTQEEVDEHMAKFGAFDDLNDIEADKGPENRLQKKINRWCREHGYPYLSFKQSKAVKKLLPAGWPDVIIFMKHPRALVVELKSKTGRPSKEQLDYKRVFKFLGWEWYLVKSYKQFLGIVNKT